MPKNDCPACDDSGRVPTRSADLCNACRLEARTAVRRAADEGRQNGGPWPTSFVEWYERTPMLGRRRRLTLDVLRAVEVSDAFDTLSACGRKVRP